MYRIIRRMGFDDSRRLLYIEGIPTEEEAINNYNIDADDSTLEKLTTPTEPFHTLDIQRWDGNEWVMFRRCTLVRDDDR